MSDDKEKVLRMALKAVLVAAQELHVDTDELCETAIQSMLRDKVYHAEDVAKAATVIEVAVDALVVE